MLWTFLALLPWILLGSAMAFGIREPRPLPPAGESDSHPLPFVSVVIPARNEARNIVRCLESLAALEYPDFEVVVVDDRSDDGTAALARGVSVGRAREIRVVEGEELPTGWFGKPWACRQGAAAARGELLLFTDADTVHAPDLLLRAVNAMEEDGVPALSLLGEQQMESLAERLVQPQLFTLLGLRFRRLDRVLQPEDWEDAIANGQYVLIRREVYEEIGGHEAVRDEVVEDLRLAQEVVRAGHPFSVRMARDAFATRMYTSLPEIVNGWTKNVAVGARQAAGAYRHVILPVMLAFVGVAWLLPPAVLAWVGAMRMGGIGPTGSASALPPLPTWVAGWALLATLCTVLIWIGVYHRLGSRWYLGLVHPLGACVLVWILLRSWLRGERRIEWKGRRYSGGEVV